MMARVLLTCWGSFGDVYPYIGLAFALLGVGLLGGFTTFSAFSLELVNLWQRGAPGLAAVYALASVLAGVAGLLLGLTMMRAAA